MQLQNNFLQHTLNALSAHIAIVDHSGTILAVNTAWTQFAQQNGLCPSRCGPGVNYLNACCNPCDPSPDGNQVGHALRKVTAGEESYFYHEYPCHSPTEQRWFSLRFTRFESDGEAFVVVAHDNITARKLAELKVQETNQALRKLTLTDSLTGAGNRRAFDERIGQEWHRQHRSQRPLTVAMIDIDCFKMFNDHYGHQSGDEAIRQVGATITKSLRLPTDFVGRYGGEEFAVIMPDTNVSQAKSAMRRILAGITALKIDHGSSSVAPYVTVSIGVADAIPDSETSPDQVVKRADEALYLAKLRGRNRIAVGKPVVPAQPLAVHFGQISASEIR